MRNWLRGQAALSGFLPENHLLSGTLTAIWFLADIRITPISEQDDAESTSAWTWRHTVFKLFVAWHL